MTATRPPLVRPQTSRSLALPAALAAAGLLLAACQTDHPARPASAASALSYGDSASSSEDNSAAAFRRLFSPLRTGPSGR